MQLLETLFYLLFYAIGSVVLAVVAICMFGLFALYLDHRKYRNVPGPSKESSE